MRSLARAAICAAFLAFTFSAASTAATVRSIAVPAGTPVLFALVDPLSSASAQPEQIFRFTIVKDVVIGHMIVIPKGALGQGHVVSASSAKMLGRPGTLLVSFDWVTSADGKRLHLANTAGAVGDSNEGTQVGVSIATSVVTDAALTTGIGAVVPYAAFAQFLVKGKNIAIDSKTLLRAYVAITAHVKATQRATTSQDDNYDE